MADKNNKDVIYIDIDDEITGIIDKVRGSDARILALVLPKRATVFQSIVNMKLLKRAADEDNKRLVLITSEAGLLPLAGAVGVHVAKSLQTKPAIPAGPVTDDGEETIEEAELPAEVPITAETAGDKPIGELAGPAAAAGTPLTTGEALETVELDNDEEPGDAPASAAPLPLAAKGAKKDKKLKVPDFNRFRLWLVLGVLALILLIFLIVLALKVLPKAAITIKTNASNVNTNLSLTLDTAAKQLDPATNTVPAKQAQQQKTYTQQVPATGQKNEGDKATGTIVMTTCATSPSQLNDVPQGTGVSSSGGLTYITQKDATFSYAGSCGTSFKFQSNSVDITAQNAGSSYNVSSGTAFTVAGRNDITATGSADGGTDNVVKVVSQSDIDSAKSKINTNDPSIKQALKSQLQQSGYYAVVATFSSGTPNVTSSANVGDAADNVTVTEAVTYTMLGAKQSDLQTLLTNQIKGQIDTSKQSILDNGLSAASVNLNNSTATTAQLTLQTTAVVGPDLNVASIKKQAAGKKSGDVENTIKSNPGVTDVTIKLSPFWVNSVPSNTSKITVTIAKPANTVNAKNP